jgi:hypothetical protein
MLLRNYVLASSGFTPPRKVVRAGAVLEPAWAAVRGRFEPRDRAVFCLQTAGCE